MAPRGGTSTALARGRRCLVVLATTGIACVRPGPSAGGPPLANPPPPSSPASAEPPPSSTPPDDPASRCAPPSPQDAACATAELTGGAPCETICRHPREAAPDRCCEGPVDVVVSSGEIELLRVRACEFVPPDCADVHGHGSMDAHLRVLSGSPPEIVLVEGGCEARAMAHGYVPDGVAAWTGCVHRRFRWDGERLAPSHPAQPAAGLRPDGP